MAEVRWTSQALDDLESVCRYIERDSPRVAEAFAGRVFGLTDQLELFLRSGRILPELEREDIRELIVFNYRVIYLLTPDEVVHVLTVRHGARLLDEWMPPEPPDQ